MGCGWLSRPPTTKLLCWNRQSQGTTCFILKIREVSGFISRLRFFRKRGEEERLEKEGALKVHWRIRMPDPFDLWEAALLLLFQWGYVERVKQVSGCGTPSRVQVGGDLLGNRENVYMWSHLCSPSPHAFSPAPGAGSCHFTVQTEDCKNLSWPAQEENTKSSDLRGSLMELPNPISPQGWLQPHQNKKWDSGHGRPGSKESQPTRRVKAQSQDGGCRLGTMTNTGAVRRIQKIFYWENKINMS